MTEETNKEEMEHGERDEDVYSKEGTEKLVEDGEMEPREAAFMAGARGEGQLGKDALTGEPILDIEHAIELEIDGILYRFINQENAEKFKEKKSKGF
ncbi:hypothetical protein HOI26_04930 [Candidatus Woesearchaeota archaeon]|jgi:hypothetical protein|nr:hypothetical protein [Candidatus Woesearchaeota archaeon]MBT5740415.1 hypothetical protein [Candidatus Woesearchaeota archaeon]